MKYLFFFLIIPFLIIPNAYAEIGKNFDLVKNQDGSLTWTSSPDRIFNGVEWIDYKFTNNADSLIFEATGGSIILDKNSCEFGLYEGGFTSANTRVIENYKAEFYKDNVKTLSSCVINKITENEENVIIELNKDGLKTKFIFAMGGIEWFYDLENMEGKQTTFKIIEICKNCNPDRIENGKLFFGDIILDTKNEQHKTLKGIDTSTQNIRIEYEKVLDDGEKFNIDPTFSDTSSLAKNLKDDGNNDLCDGDNLIELTLSFWYKLVNVAGSSQDCQRTFLEWDISSILPNAIITNVTIIVDLPTVITPTPCDVNAMTGQPSVKTDAQNWIDIGDGTNYITGNTDCQTTGANQVFDLGGNGILDVQTAIDSSQSWFAIGLLATTETIDAIHEISLDPAGTPPPTLEIEWNLGFVDAVTDLISTDIRGTGVTLSWSTPNTNGTIVGYQINNTTPHNSNVATELLSTTNSTSTTFDVSGLTGSTDYSFRIGARLSIVNNASGNVLNITTDFDPIASFTAGTFNITTAGTDVRNFKFERIDLNTTAILLNVTYPNTFNTTCNFHFKFAMVNQSHFNLVDVPINAAEDEASFRFEGVDNEIIDVVCNDENSNVTGDFLITQTSFMILEQIQDFQSGAFGTMGKFGALDLITVFAVIASMIGFNRVNESVGVILSVIMIGALSVFQIIQWETTFTASLALVVLWAYTNTRKP